MKIGVFAYNFPHWKTQAGIQNLCISGNKPDIVLAADPVDLKFYKSKIRIAPKDIFLWHPKRLCEYYGIEYRVVKHSSEETSKIIKQRSLSIGVILGARILKPMAFENFELGVINMHPGILPENRGLDNIKWAIINNIPQGVTTHIVDEKIDRGLKILQEEINIYPDDSLVDIQVRLQNLEQKLMIESISHVKEHGVQKLESLSKGTYYKSIPPEYEEGLLDIFPSYKRGQSCQV